MTGGSTVTLEGDGTSTGNTGVGSQPSGQGELHVSGNGSSFDAGGILGIGYDIDTASAGGTGEVTVRDDGEIVADDVRLATADSELEIGTTGQLTVNNDYIMTAGRLSLDIGGSTPGNFAAFTAANQADIDGGTIALSFVDGYLPTAGQSFQFFTATNGLSLIHI